MMILSFELTMPNKGSWNGRWSGEQKKYFRFKTLSNKVAKAILDGEESRGFYYSWGDGWGANVRVTHVLSKEKAKLQRISAGFCGYEWMIESIIKHGKIIND